MNVVTYFSKLSAALRRKSTMQTELLEILIPDKGPGSCKALDNKISRCFVKYHNAT